MSPYCDHIKGRCALEEDSEACREKSPVACRNMADKIEREVKDGKQ